ncbi:MAG TPA: twin-arginine translocase TatA/TatE family subunit [Byssovorax sp.]
MFGFSMGEITLLLIVGIIVVGPKKLPAMMRTAGHWVQRLRRVSSDLRSQSGIDDLIRQEGLEREIAELRSLSRVNVIDTIMSPAIAAAAPAALATSSAPMTRARTEQPVTTQPLREREYPALGCDAYGALPEDAKLYHHHEPPAPNDRASDAPSIEVRESDA